MAVALLAASLLGGCVMFEQPPAPLACDPALVGRWIPLPNSPQDRIPLGKDDHADVDSACRVRLHDAAPPALSQNRPAIRCSTICCRCK